MCSSHRHAAAGVGSVQLRLQRPAHRTFASIGPESVRGHDATAAGNFFASNELGTMIQLTDSAVALVYSTLTTRQFFETCRPAGRSCIDSGLKSRRDSSCQPQRELQTQRSGTHACCAESSSITEALSFQARAPLEQPLNSTASQGIGLQIDVIF
jgi:hypothetical protein